MIHSLPCRVRGPRSENRTIARARAAASTARPPSSPPISRVLNGNAAAASAARISRAPGSTAEPGLALCCGDTTGKRLPGEPAGVIGPGSSNSEAAGSAAERRVGRRPAGSVAPRPAPDADVGAGEAGSAADGFAVIVMAAPAAGGAVASLALAVAVRTACIPAAVLPGTAIVASSSSEAPSPIPPAVQVRPLAEGHTVNEGVTSSLPALPLTVTVTPPAAPPAGHTRIASPAFPPGCTPCSAVIARTCRQSWTEGLLPAEVGLGEGLGEREAVVLGEGEGEAEALLLGLAEALLVGLADALLLGVAVALGEGEAGALLLGVADALLVGSGVAVALLTASAAAVVMAVPLARAELPVLAMPALGGESQAASRTTAD